MSKIIQKYKEIPVQMRASIWFMICGVLQKAISFITTPIFTRLLSTSDYGAFSVYLSWQSIIMIFASLNLASGVYLRGLIKYDQDKRAFTASLQSLFLLIFTVVFLLYYVFHTALNARLKMPTLFICLMFADILLQTAFHFWSARQRVSFLYRNLVLLTVLNALAKPTLGVIFAVFYSDGVLGRIYSILLSDLTCFGYLFIQMIGGLKSATAKYWRYALSYNIPLVPHYLSQIILNQSDRIMINNMVDPGKAGIYSLAYSVAAILVIVNQSVLNSYNPWMYQCIKDREYQPIRYVSYSLLVFIAAINFAVIICAPEVIGLMAPSTYYEAVWIIPPVTISVFFMFLYSLFANFEFYYEKTNIMMFASIIGAGLNIVLNFISIPRFGYISAGYTTLVCYLCYCIAHYCIMNRILRKELPDIKIYDMRIVIIIAAVFCIISFGAMALYRYRLIRYSILICFVILTVLKRHQLLRIAHILNGKINE